VAIVIPAEGSILDRVLQTAHTIAPEGLSRQAYAKFDAAQMKTAWGRRHQRRFALVDGADVLASAKQYNLAAVLDQRPVWRRRAVLAQRYLLTRESHEPVSPRRVE
jgi:hypothetical protein